MGPLALAAIIGGGQIVGAKLSRDAAKKERDNHFVNLRESARRGGYHPLTAIRATGGGGYGQYVPLLSRSPLGEGISAGTSFYANMQRDMYFTRENQAHDVRMNRINNQAAMDRTNASNMTRSSSNPKYDYDNAGETWPVQWNGQTLNIPTSVAEQLRIPKNGMLMVEHLEAAYGSMVAEGLALMSGEALEKILGMPVHHIMKTLKQDNGPDTPKGDPFTGFEGEPTMTWDQVMQGVHNIINGGWGSNDTISRRALGRQYGGQAGM
jgi:hypothetical protein